MDKILEQIYKAGLKFLAPLTLEKTYKIVAEEAKKLAKADSASIYLKQGNKLNRVYSSSAIMSSFKQRQKGFVYRVYRTHKPIIVDMTKLTKIHPEFKAARIKSTVLIPLSYRNRAVGVISVQSYKEKYFDDQVTRILNLFASLASLAIRKTQLYDKAEKALKNRDLFISLAGHELRTPVTTIYGYAQLLYKKYQKEDSAEAKWVKSLHEESSRLTLLIKDLLEIDRIKSGSLHYNLKECSLKEVIKIAVESFKFSYPTREVVFENLSGRKGCKIIGDSDKLLQVVTNLLDNSVKFSADDSRIIIRLESKSHQFILRVQDQGTGISKKDLPRVFEGYYKGRNVINEGMGLGLFLAKKIINQHNGSINVYSKENKGTIVEIKLPKVKYA